MTKKITAQSIALCGMMAALIFVATYFLKIPMVQGYIHLGDGFILIASAVLGWPAVVSAALGSMLADLLAGYTVYMLPTFIIKGAVAAIAVIASRRNSQPVQMFYMLVAEIVMVAGYFLTEWFILGFGLAAASSAILGNVLQGLSGVAIWVLLMPVVKRIRKQPQ
ncbi:MAG TPA: ECF transporter S component [Candidatus Limiplasma sp.]|nr:ECF transporter S component [Candidatus Limiplasma sp.]